MKTLTAARPRVTYFVSTESQPRVRRMADVVTAVVGFLLLAWGVFSIDRSIQAEESLTELLTDLPSWVEAIAAVVYVAGLLFGLVVVVSLIVTWRRRGKALRDVLLAIVVAVALALALAQGFTGEWPYILPELGLEDPEARFPVLRVVTVVAILVAASPHLTRPIRRTGWATIVLIGLAAVVLSYGAPSDSLGSVGIGMLGAASVLLVFGSPAGYPDLASVAEALGGMGLAVDGLRIDPAQSWGVRRFVGEADGDPLTIKAYGRDASDTARMSKAWRTLTYRESGRTVTLTRLQAVEHEALVTMMAERAGPRVPAVIAAGEASSEMALLVEQGGIPPLSELDPDEVDDATLVRIWQDVALLRDASISHGSLTTDAVRYDGNEHVISDFYLGSVTASESDHAHDVVELLVSMSQLVGVERAARSALQGIGAEAITATLPYLQLPAVSRQTRRNTEDAKSVIAELQTTLTDLTESEMPEPAKLRRVSGRNLLTAVLLAFAVSALIGMLTDIDFQEVWAILQDATWSLIVLAFGVGQVVYIPQAMGMLFAVGVTLPFWPLVILQIAIMFIGLAVPSVAGRVAMNSAFLYKFGVSVTRAVTQGAIDSFTGFIVEALILIIAIIYYGGVAGDVELDLDDVPWLLLLAILLIAVIAIVVAIRRIGAVRERVMPVIDQARDAVVGLAKDPGRAAGLFAANLTTRLIWGSVLWLVLEAVHTPINFGACLVAVVGTSLLQGVVPVPGGIGVSEAVMTGILVAFGVEENAAFAATVTYRLITFYIPSAAGFFAMRWLERNQYL